MFSWCKACQTVPSGSGYLVQKQSQPPKFYQKIADIHQSDLSNSQTAVLRVNKSQFDSLNTTLNGKDRKFVDNQFSPSDVSLGTFSNIKTDKWKRLSQLIDKPVLFNKQIYPSDGVSSNNKFNNGYQAAIAALAEKEERIKTIFGVQSYNPKGIYTFLLRVKGKIQQVIIDDYVPVGQQGQPLFAKPHENSIWVPLIQKARAKSYGSYYQMIKNSQNPKTPLQQLTFATSESIKSTMNKEQIWCKIVQSVQKGSICIGLTNQQQKVNWGLINLTPNHYYTILDAGSLTHKLGSSFKVIKLRNAFANQQYKGQGSLNDTLFWDQVQNNDQRLRLLQTNSNKDGVIYMLFSDYLKYFSETIINSIIKNRNFDNQKMQFNTHNGLIYQLKVFNESQYSIFIDENEMEPQKKGLQYIEDGWSRATILLIKDNSLKNVGQNYEYVDGVLKYNEKQADLKVRLAPGKYMIYAKLQPTLKQLNFPNNSHLGVFSSQSILLKESNQQQYPQLLKRTFLEDARKFKRQQYNNNTMWSSWKLVAHGGYAYIVFGNTLNSNSKFVIKFSELVFNKENYILKKPFKGKGEQVLQILPGKQEIMLLRIKNSDVKQINFPPPIDLEIINLTKQ